MICMHILFAIFVGAAAPNAEQPAAQLDDRQVFRELVKSIEHLASLKFPSVEEMEDLEKKRNSYTSCIPRSHWRCCGPANMP